MSMDSVQYTYEALHSVLNEEIDESIKIKLVNISFYTFHTLVIKILEKTNLGGKDFLLPHEYNALLPLSTDDKIWLLHKIIALVNFLDKERTYVTPAAILAGEQPVETALLLTRIAVLSQSTTKKMNFKAGKFAQEYTLLCKDNMQRIKDGVTKFQALYRGYEVRKRLKQTPLLLMKKRKKRKRKKKSHLVQDSNQSTHRLLPVDIIAISSETNPHTTVVSPLPAATIYEPDNVYVEDHNDGDMRVNTDVITEIPQWFKDLEASMSMSIDREMSKSLHPVLLSVEMNENTSVSKLFARLLESNPMSLKTLHHVRERFNPAEDSLSRRPLPSKKSRKKTKALKPQINLGKHNEPYGAAEASKVDHGSAKDVVPVITVKEGAGIISEEVNMIETKEADIIPREETTPEVTKGLKRGNCLVARSYSDRKVEHLSPKLSKHNREESLVENPYQIHQKITEKPVKKLHQPQEDLINPDIRILNKKGRSRVRETSSNILPALQRRQEIIFDQAHIAMQQWSSRNRLKSKRYVVPEIAPMVTFEDINKQHHERKSYSREAGRLLKEAEANYATVLRQKERIIKGSDTAHKLKKSTVDWNDYEVSKTTSDSAGYSLRRNWQVSLGNLSPAIVLLSV